MPHRSESDHQRFDRLYADHLPLILGYATRRCTQQGDAADVAAEVFLVAWRRLHDIPPGEERLWLFGVARRVLANQSRSRLRRKRLADRVRSDLAVGGPDAAVADPATGRTEAVLAALHSLPETDRELLRLTAWDGLTPSEIAVLESVPAATVRSRLLRARARLRVALAELEATDSPTTSLGAEL